MTNPRPASRIIRNADWGSAIMELLEARTFLSASAVTRLEFITQPSSTNASSHIGPISVRLEDGNGHTVATDRGPLTLTIESGPVGATLGGVITAKPKNGVATFNLVTLLTPGTYTLKVSKGSIQATSSVFGVNGLVITQIPTTNVDNTSFSIQVAIEDAAGSVITSDSSSVLSLKLSSIAKNTLLQGNLIATAQGGVATFTNLTIPRTGIFSLIATSGNLQSLSRSLSVVPGAPAKLKVVSVYANHIPVVGHLGPVTVDVLDANNNLANNLNGTSNTTATTVTLTLKTTLSTEVTFGTMTTVLTITQAATAGVAVFPTTVLTAQRPGWYTLTVTAGNLTQDSLLVFIR